MEKKLYIFIVIKIKSIFYQISVNEFAFVIDPSDDESQVPVEFTSFRLTDVHILKLKLRVKFGN